MSTTTPGAYRRPETVTPSEEDLEQMLKLSRFLEDHTADAVIVGPDGQQTSIPESAYRVLVAAAEAMRHHQAVTIAPIDQQLTTQQAADMLGISRPTLVKLVEDGTIPCSKPSGSRHRRIRLADLLAYQRAREQQRSQALDELVEDAEDDGLYDIPGEDFTQAVKNARAGRRP